MGISTVVNILLCIFFYEYTLSKTCYILIIRYRSSKPDSHAGCLVSRWTSGKSGFYFEGGSRWSCAPVPVCPDSGEGGSKGEWETEGDGCRERGERTEPGSTLKTNLKWPWSSRLSPDRRDVRSLRPACVLWDRDPFYRLHLRETTRKIWQSPLCRITEPHQIPYRVFFFFGSLTESTSSGSVTSTSVCVCVPVCVFMCVSTALYRGFLFAAFHKSTV